MAAISVNDGGTWRTPAAVYVNDGGTWRTIQQVYVNDGGTWRTVFQYLLYDGTITEGISGGFDVYGFSNGNYGSASPATLGDGTTLATVVDNTTLGQCTVEISGFGADPGFAYFSSITVGGVQKFSSTANYIYFAGVGVWEWAGEYFGLDGSGSSTVVINP